MAVLSGETKKVIADARLKHTMSDLKERYGKVPDAGATVEELKVRVESLSYLMDDILEDYMEEAGVRPDIMKATHPVAYNGEFPQKKCNDIEVYANVSDSILRKAPVNTQEGIANLLLDNTEYLIRAHRKKEIETRSAAEWRQLEREYVNSSRFTIMDLYSDYKDLIEEGVMRYVSLLTVFGFQAMTAFDELLTWEDYREERKKWKRCKHRFCLNMFPISKDNFKFSNKAKKRDAKYCCGACNENEKYARRCFEKTGKLMENATFLPDFFYEEVTEDWKGKRSRNLEVATDILTIEKQIHANKPIRKPIIKVEKTPVYGCVTRKLSDVTPEELESEKWQSAKKVPRIAEESREYVPLYIAGVSGESVKTPIILIA